MHDKSLSITPNSVHCDAITSTDMNIENVTFSFLSRAPSESPESHRQRLGSSLGKSSTDDFHITSPRLWMQFTFYSCVCLYILHSPQLILSILYLSGHLQLNQHRWLGFVSTDHKISGKRLKTCQCVSISESSRPSICVHCVHCVHTIVRCTHFTSNVLSPFLRIDGQEMALGVIW